MASLLNMFIGESSNIPEEKPTKTTNFCLPIEYLDKSDICNLNESVIDDLEMVSQKNDETKSTCMYEHLVIPNDEFSHEMIPKLSNKFTHNTIFLKESQDILRTFPEYELQIKESYGSYDVSYSEIMEVWKATKEDKNFMERYL